MKCTKGRIFCSSCSCKYWTDVDGRLYGVCSHSASYSLIDRKMVGDCNLYERKVISVTDPSEEEVELKS